MILGLAVDVYGQYGQRTDEFVLEQIQPPIDSVDIGAALDMAFRLQNRDEDELAYEWIQRADSLMKASGNELLRYRYFRRLGGYYEYFKEDLDSSDYYWEQSLEAARESDQPGFIVDALRTLALNAYQRENYRHSMLYFEEARALAKEHEMYARYFDATGYQAVILEWIDQHERAEEIMDNFESLIPTLEGDSLQAFAMTEFAGFYWNQGDLPTTLFWYLQAAEKVRRTNDPAQL